LKGAPERVIEMCDKERTGAGEQALSAEIWRARADELAARGQRVLAFAAKPMPQGTQDLRFDEVEHGLVLLGLAGFIDPPRDEAITAVADCRSAGIRVLMITGDHAVTAREIARQLGISESPRALTG